jgi:hypothetical protein
MTWVTAILAGLQALPKLLKLLEKLGEIDLNGDIKALQEAADDYEKAHTLEARLIAARKLFHATKRL